MAKHGGDADILCKAIADSGFPFELEVAQAFARLGYDIKPSFQFYDKSRDKDTELDLVAAKNFEFTTQSEGLLKATLRIGIECKDSRQHFLCFGLERSSLTDDRSVSSDLFFSHFRTSRDQGIKNRFSLRLFHPKSGVGAKVVEHHHFAGAVRFHILARTEKRGDNSVKVHVPDDLHSLLAKLGAFVGHAEDQSSGLSDRDLEDLSGAPYVNVVFTALIHRGIHWRVIGASQEPRQASHTAVFRNRSYSSSAISYVVDVIGSEGLEVAVATIENSFHSLVSTVAPYLLACDPP